MAISQCLRCGNRSFESVAKIPIGYPCQVMFIQCSVCGGVVGVQEIHNQKVKRIPDRTDQKQETVKPLFKPEHVMPSDINIVLKRLYG